MLIRNARKSNRNKVVTNLPHQNMEITLMKFLLKRKGMKDQVITGYDTMKTTCASHFHSSTIILSLNM